MMALLAAAAGILILAFAVTSIENRLIFFPPRYPTGFPTQKVNEEQVEDLWLTTADGVRINAFFLSNPASRQVLLWFHGNAENIGYGLGQMQALARVGTNILAVDYRGYGKSEGEPSETGVYHDADAAYDYLVGQRHFQPQDVLIYGHSLGGAVAVNLACHRPCGGLIVQASFTSVRAMARRMFENPVIPLFAWPRFNSLDRIRQVHAPILIVHGTRDQVVPIAMARELFAAAPEPKWFYPVEGAGHNDLLETGGEQYLARLQQFATAAASHK